MAGIDFWWIGLHESPANNLRLLARCASNGQLSATVNGVIYNGTVVNTTVNDGVGVVNISGLNPDTNYSFTLGQDGTSVTGSARTCPAGNETIKFVVTSCELLNQKRISPGPMLVEFVHPHFIATLGDFYYTNGVVSNVWGETPTAYNTSVTTGKQPERYRELMRQCMRNPGSAYKNYAPVVRMSDDHEWGGDNWDHSLANAFYPSGGLNYDAASIQADCDDYFLAGNTALLEYFVPGNPANPDAPTAQKPNLAQVGTPVSNYPARYTRWAAGPCEFFMLDCITHRHEVAAVDNASKTMLGTTQKQWLKDRLAACSATYAFILSGKKTYPNNSDNSDAWFPGGTNVGYITERDEILDYINAKAGWANPNLTVVWLSGDTHIGNVIENTAKKHVCINGCPMGADGLSSATGLNTNVRYMGPRMPDVTDSSYRCFTYVEVSLIRAEIWIYNSLGRQLWHGGVNAGANAISYLVLPVAI